MMMERAIEIFVHGFAFTRSATHPCLSEVIAPGVWVLRDAPRTHGEDRSEEYVAFGVPAATVNRLARQYTRGHFRVCVVQSADGPDVGIRADFRALGYRLMTTETFMLHRLSRVEPVPEPFPVCRVTTAEQVQLLTTAAHSRPLSLALLTGEPAPVRQYMALDGATPVGWVTSIAVGDGAWCTGMFVQAAYRRRGIARALLTNMLRDDRAAGAAVSVLLASHAGSALYPTVGFETLGTLLMFVPRKAHEQDAR
ncbi:MAG TPA: GNAT family N-acetyltransferase, partial [Chloroflexota bacterium]|nr:GNAT family N-acetyltransferase [Chloroflexota bacterium]